MPPAVLYTVTDRSLVNNPGRVIHSPWGKPPGFSDRVTLSVTAFLHQRSSFDLYIKLTMI